VRDEEQLILVDEDNRAVGSAGKTTIHRRGLLHRAFSVFVVDSCGRIVLQRRNPKKYHSGGLWANSCCGHPRPGERTISAARRRLDEELGLRSPLSFGFFARYRAELDNGMQENELVYVFFGPLLRETRPNPEEVVELAVLSCDDIRRRLLAHPVEFTFWLKHYFSNHAPQIKRLAEQASRAASPGYCSPD
jgi:isopentenyl-diphosphate delta-isomerase